MALSQRRRDRRLRARDRARAREPSRASTGAPRRRSTRCGPGSSRRAPRGRVRNALPGPGDRARVVERWRCRRRPRARRAGRAGSSAEALVAPVDRGAQRALALRKIDRPLHLEREPLAERAQDLRRRENGESRGDELDREREAVETAADLVHRRERVVLQDHAARGGELDEERRRVLDRERLERKNALGREAERRAARREHLEVRRAVEERRDVDGCRREVLEVVEVEERARAVEPVCDRDEQWRAARLADADRARDRARDEIGVRTRARARRGGRAASSAARAATSSASRLFPAPPGPVIVTRRRLGSRAGSRPARARRRGRRGGGGAPEGSSPRASSAVGSRRGGPARRAGRAAPRTDTSFSRWRPSGRNDAPGSGSSPAMSSRCPRDDDLLAVRGRADARSDDDVHADVALVAELGLARVDADPKAVRRLVRPRLGGERALDLGRGGDRVPRPRESKEDPVAGPVDLGAAVVTRRRRARARACARERARSARPGG